MKGSTVRISAGFRMPESWPRMGKVIGESEECVGIRLEGIDTPVIVPKRSVGIVLT
jgi:hypothetical protein